MVQFSAIPDEVQTTLAKATPAKLDLTPYLTAIDALIKARPEGESYSRFFRVDLGPDDNEKGTKRRFTAAATERGEHLDYRAVEGAPGSFYLRLRPAPVARAKPSDSAAPVTANGASPAAAAPQTTRATRAAAPPVPAAG